MILISIIINILFFKVVNIHSEHLLYLTFNINDLYLFYRCWIIIIIGRERKELIKV